MINMVKKYKLSIIISSFIILIGLIITMVYSFVNNSLKILEYKNDDYSLKYDRGWKIKEKKKNNIILKHGNDAKINIQIIELKSESKYSDIEDLLDELIYNIDKQNKNYKLINKKETTFTKYNFKGYKILYETKTNQLIISVYKKSDKLVLFSYEASNKYCDILLDSAENIIYNFDLKEKKYKLNSKVSLNTSEILYSEDKKLDQSFNKTENYEIATYNYYVKYTIPSTFELSDFDSTRNYFNYKEDEKYQISISTNIYQYNIFEYLDKDNIVNVYKDYETYKKDKDYSNFQETVTKIDGKVDTYLYKNSYSYDKAITYDKNFKKKEYQRKDENAVLIYSLDKNHIMLVKIEAKGTSITQKLINSIKIKKIENYASYVTSEIKDNYLISNLKRYDEYSNKQITQITVKIPDKYKEYDFYNNNIYSDRYFGLNYNEENEMYDYQVHYRLSSKSLKIDDLIDSIQRFFSEGYGPYNYLTNQGEIAINNKKFIVYSGGYTQLGGIPFTNINRFEYYINKKVLFYKLETGGYLVIEISGNGKEITDEILEDTINFEIKNIFK